MAMFCSDRLYVLMLIGCICCKTNTQSLSQNGDMISDGDEFGRGRIWDGFLRPVLSVKDSPLFRMKSIQEMSSMAVKRKYFSWNAEAGGRRNGNLV